MANLPYVVAIRFFIFPDMPLFEFEIYFVFSVDKAGIKSFEELACRQVFAAVCDFYRVKRCFRHSEIAPGVKFTQGCDFDFVGNFGFD